MNLSDHFHQILLTGALGLASLGVNFLSRLSSDVGKMTVSVVELNSKIEMMNEKTSSTQEQLKDHEGRIRFIERKK